MNKPEILAPAGSEAALCAAVQSGADAVYVGGSRFSARASANNFDAEAMRRAVAYCHLRGVKLYVTQNTLIKQSELEEAVRYAAYLYEIGVDALIVQDLGLARAIAQAMPDFPLHASTQMTVHNLEGVRALEKLGFTRVVLARELSEKQMAYIAKNCKAELEVFVHGALCFSYSGQCLLSSVLGGRSGNRGRCAQPCRLPYTLYAKDGKKIKSGYLMSPKDLALLDNLQSMCSMPIASLKIEGRLKKPSYVATVTKVYRELLDSGKRADKKDYQTLLNAFNRSGFTDAYFRGRRGIEMMSVNNPSNVSEERFSQEALARCAENANFRRIAVDMTCTLTPSHPARLFVRDADGYTAEVCGDVAQAAQNRPVTEEEIRTRLEKTGATAFEARKVDVEIYGDVFMPVAALNALRRSALEELEKQRTVGRTSVADLQFEMPKRAKQSNALEFCVHVQTLAQAKVALEYAPKILYAPASVLEKLQAAENTQFVTALPEILTDDKRTEILQSVRTDTMLACGIDTLQEEKRVHTDFRIGVYNAQTALRLLEMGAERITVSPELNLQEITALGTAVLEKATVMAYGRLPLMVMQNCLMRSYCGACRKMEGRFILRDRTNAEFLVLCRPEACVNVLYNAKPTYMADKLTDLMAAGVRTVRLDFTDEDAAQTRAVLEAYLSGTGEAPVQNTFTRGHFYRGVQ